MKEIEKIKLFRETFRGRTDAYGAGSKEAVKETISDAVLRAHVQGKSRVGVYPLSPDIMDGSGTWWIAADIDVNELGFAAIAAEAIEHLNIPCYVERSKSKGYHVWVFFSEPIEAKLARAIIFYASGVLERDTDYRIYEMFPKQNSIKHDDGSFGYGNYINLPLFGRDVQKEKTVFLNALDHYRPYPDQWSFLKSLLRVEPSHIGKLIELVELIEMPERREPRRREGTETDVAHGMSGLLAVMMEKCAFCREFLPDTGEIHEELWYRWLTQMVCFEGGEELAFQLSSGSPKFDAETTRKKIAHAKDAKEKGLAPYTCAEIIDCQGWSSPECENCYASPSKRNSSPAGLPYILKSLEFEKQKVFSENTSTLPPSECTEKLSHFDTINQPLQPEPNSSHFDILSYRCTDSGNAELFAKLHGQNLRYDHKHEKWFRWNGNYWEIDILKSVSLLAKNTAQTRLKAASNISDDEARAKQAKWAISSESFQKINACISLAQKEPPIAVDNSIWDTTDMLLVVQNGTIDLLTGELRKSKRDDYLSRCANVTYDEKADCPRWKQFLQEIYEENQNLVDYVQRAIGYSLTGAINEHCFFLCYGTGRNGKGTLLNNIASILNGYAASTAFSTFEWNKYQQNTNDLAALKGVRFLSAQETKEARQLNEARIKAVTGGDPITCRYLYSEFFTYIPKFKVWLSVNHKPTIRDTSLGMWSRVRLLPFNVNFWGREDKQLPTQLEAEKAGILNWAIEGCKKWQELGLDEPLEVLVETQKYREESDPIAIFLDEKTIHEKTMQTRAIDLFTAYEEWAKANGEWVMSNQFFGRRLREKGFTKEKRGGVYYYHGIGIITN